MVDAPAILIATTNRGKLREVRRILADLGVRLADLDDFPGLAVPIEDGDSFQDNATMKALHYSRLTGCLTLADDSGLEVDALNGAPGVRSARYAGPESDPAANNAKLVALLASVPPAKRTARFRCVAALAEPSGIVATTSGVLEGLIITKARGTNGFGYDPHFLIPDRNQTTAEMPTDVKNSISHRGTALAAMRELLTKYLNGPRPI